MPMTCTILLTTLLVLLVATGSIVVYAVDRLIHPRRSLARGTPADYGLPCRKATFCSPAGITLRGWFMRAPDPHRVDSGFAELRTIILNPMQKRGIPRLLASFLTTLTVWAAGWRLGGHLPDSDPLRWVNRLATRPLLIIHAGQDLDIPVNEAYRLYKAAAEPRELWIVGKAEHGRVDQICQEEYMGRILLFFDRWLDSKSCPQHRYK